MQTAVSRFGIVCPSALILTKEIFTKISIIVFTQSLFDKTSEEIIKGTEDVVSSDLLFEEWRVQFTKVPFRAL